MIDSYREDVRDFLRENSQTIRISVIFGLCNVILPLILVTWFFNRATDVRHPFALLSQPRDEINP